MRALVLLLALVLAAPAAAQTYEPPEARVARVMLAALAPERYGDWAYGWSAVSIRVSSLMNWHLPDPDPRDRPPDADVARSGWIGGVGVIAVGNDERVNELRFQLGGGLGGADDTAMLEALRAAGAVISDESVHEISAHYTISAEGRDTRVLTRATICTPPGSRAARTCRLHYTLHLEELD